MSRSADPARPGAAHSAAPGWLLPALLLVLVALVLRVAGLWINATDLFVDEAQYWLWGQEPALGYYSKPPMIAWVIRGFGEVCGDSAFCIRLPAPILHSVTALVLGAVAARLSGRRAAVLVVAAWLTLPMVSLSSLMISTDVVMFPFLALALLALVACLGGAGLPVAFAGGIALGLAFLSKYAALYYLGCAVLAAGLHPRLGLRAALGFLAGFALAAAPNVLWNLGNGLTTLEHTLDNVDWVREGGARAGLNPAGLAEFLGAQFAVFGPVLFAALLWLAAGWRRRDSWQRRWLIFSLPIVALVCVQALLSRAYANWAAAAYLAGVLLVVPFLAREARGWLRISFAINLVLAVALPLTTIAPALIAPGGRPAAERYLGRSSLSLVILNLARTEGVTTVVSDNRDILADLFHTGRASGLTFAAQVAPGRAPHHYAMRYPFRGAEAPVLYVGLWDAPCPEAEPLGRIEPQSGAWRGRSIGFWKAAPACLLPK